MTRQEALDRLQQSENNQDGADGAEAKALDVLKHSQDAELVTRQAQADATEARRGALADVISVLTEELNAIPPAVPAAQ